MKRICALFLILTLTIAVTACSGGSKGGNPEIGLSVYDTPEAQMLYGERVALGLSPVKAEFIDDYWFFLSSDRNIYRMNANYSDQRELLSLPAETDAPAQLHVYNGFVWVVDDACVVYKMNYDGGDFKMFNLISLLSLSESSKEPYSVRSIRSDADGTLYVDMSPNNQIYTIYADLTHDAPEAGRSVNGLVASGGGDYIGVKVSSKTDKLFNLTANAEITEFSAGPRLFDGDGNYDIYYLDGDSLYGVLADRQSAERIADFTTVTASVSIAGANTSVDVEGANITDIVTHQGELFLCVNNVGLVQLKARRAETSTLLPSSEPS
jgi:hypothetical protein